MRATTWKSDAIAVGVFLVGTLLCIWASERAASLSPPDHVAAGGDSVEIVESGPASPAGAAARHR